MRKALRRFQRRAGVARQAFSREISLGVRIKECEEFSVAYRVGTADERVIDHSFGNDIYFSTVPEYKPKPDHVVLDIGAHIGTFALLAGSKVPQGRVVAVEASAETFDLLRINVALNKLNNITPLHMAVSDKIGTAYLHHDPHGNWGHSLYHNEGGGQEKVETITLGALLKKHNIERVDLVKFNCEGAEYDILLSAEPGLLSRIGFMIVLYHGGEAGKGRFDALTGKLRNAGYVLAFRKQSADRGWIVASRDPHAFTASA
jgi:FkbM family methyltransferase